MKNLQFNDEEIAMAYFTVKMFQGEAKAFRIFDEFKGESEPCGLCDGIGNFISGSGLPCPRCGGSGKLNKKETYN